MNANTLKKHIEITPFTFEDVEQPKETKVTLVTSEQAAKAQQLADAYAALGFDHDPMNHRILKLFIEKISGGNYTTQRRF